MIGIAVDSYTSSIVEPPLTGAPAAALHVVAPTVPTPTLVDGRPA